jgi:uncharacterized membrane protein YhaH (DUF805 family)
MIQQYLAYLRDNPEGYWFKRKCYGWGWTPARKEGWFVILAYVVVLVLLASSIDEQSSLREMAFTFLLPLLILTTTLIRICYKKGEPPRWQWGVPPQKNKGTPNA